VNIDYKSQKKLKKLQFRISYLVKRISIEAKKDRKFIFKGFTKSCFHDIIMFMNENHIICSAFATAISLLLLRRKAQ